jgi:hypothetical protein
MSVAHFMCVFVYDSMLTPKYQSLVVSGQLVIWCLVLLDWLLKLLAAVSFQYYVPVRLLILVLFFDRLREALWNLVTATLEAWNIIVFFLTTVLVSALFAVVLFRNHLLKDVSAQANIPIGSEANFADIFESSASMFVVRTQNENDVLPVLFSKDFFRSFVCSLWPRQTISKRWCSPHLHTAHGSHFLVAVRHARPNHCVTGLQESAVLASTFDPGPVFRAR